MQRQFERSDIRFRSWLRSVSFPGHSHASFRHGSRAGSQNSDLVHTATQKDDQIKEGQRDDNHIIIKKGKKARKWDLHLKEGMEVNMFAHDHRLNPRVPQPTSFDGVKPSFMEWSEKVIASLSSH